MIRIKEADIQIGKPIPWDCYDPQGNLLLRHGTVIASERQLEGLISRGLFAEREPDSSSRDQVKPQAKSAFDVVEELKLRLRSLLDAIAGRQGGDVEARVFKLSQDLQKLCEHDADAALGSLHLDQEGRYSVVHPLHIAILAELIGKKKNLSEAERQVMLAAALTANVSMMELQETLQKQDAPLSDAQREELRLHPLQSVEMLLESGVQNDDWFKMVLHHHEKYDGSGYPGTLRGEDIPLSVRIISLADTYSAMITPRCYRAQIVAQAALRDIFLKRGQELDGDLAGVFIKELGIYPPGAFVRLQNGEVAVVTKRQENATTPEVFSVVGPRGAPLPTPIKRDCGKEQYVIREMVPRDKIVQLNLNKLWGYH